MRVVEAGDDSFRADVADRDVGHAAVQERVLPGDDVGARYRRRVVVAEVRDEAIYDRRPALHCRRGELDRKPAPPTP